MYKTEIVLVLVTLLSKIDKIRGKNIPEINLNQYCLMAFPGLN